MLIKSLFIFVLMLASKSTFALYGAHPANATLAKSVVTLHLVDPEHANGKAFCSGVLISSTKVLTAGHCIDVMGLELYEMSTKFIYEPDLLRVNLMGHKVKVKSVRFSTTYFDSPGLEGEDVAVLELEEKTTAPYFPIAPKNTFKLGMKTLLISRGLETSSTVKSYTSYNQHSVLQLDGSKSGVCAGDSGGALLIERNGKYELAGILLAENQGCEKSDFWSVSPSLSSR